MRHAASTRMPTKAKTHPRAPRSEIRDEEARSRQKINASPPPFPPHHPYTKGGRENKMTKVTYICRSLKKKLLLTYFLFFIDFFYRVFWAFRNKGSVKTRLKPIAENFPQPPKKSTYLLTYYVKIFVLFFTPPLAPYMCLIPDPPTNLPTSFFLDLLFW
jgi:hypothetical protein